VSELKSKSKQEELFIFDCTAQGGLYKFVRNYEFSKFPINNLVVNWFLVHKFSDHAKRSKFRQRNFK
jgi:hypothetical protein